MFKRLALFPQIHPLTPAEKATATRAFKEACEAMGKRNPPKLPFPVLRFPRPKAELSPQGLEHFEQQIHDHVEYCSVGSLPMALLNTTQDTVSTAGLEKYLNNLTGIPPKVALFKKHFFILDGHHRVIVQWLAGRKQVQIVLYQFDDQKSIIRPARLG